MKTILMFILLCLSVTGFGQEYGDSTWVKEIKQGYYHFISDSMGIVTLQWIKTKADFDTIPVLMLVSDTSQYERARIIVKIKEKRAREAQDTTNNCRWYIMTNEESVYTPPVAYHMKGYKVIETISRYHTYEGEFYIDSDKKPLKKEIVVWQFLNIK